MILENIIDQYLDSLDARDIKGVFHRQRLSMFLNDIGKGIDADHITEEDCMAFLSKHGMKEGLITTNWHVNYIALNGLFSWATTRGLMDKNPLPAETPARPDTAKPYIFTNPDLRMLFDGALIPTHWNVSIPPLVMQTALKVTLALGLRPGEPLMVTMKNVHLDEENYILLEDTKFSKTRMVPFPDRVAEIIKNLISWYKTNGFDLSPDFHLFSNKKGLQIPLITYEANFRRICKRAGIYKDDDPEHLPRLYDLRHTFVTRRVESWYREGKDLNALLPALSTFLGHVSIHSTQVYISMTQELLSNASIRFYDYVNEKD